MINQSIASILNMPSIPKIWDITPEETIKPMVASALEIEAYKKDVLLSINEVDSVINNVLDFMSEANNEISAFTDAAIELTEEIKLCSGNISNSNILLLTPVLQENQDAAIKAGLVSNALNPEIKSYIDNLKSIKDELEKVYEFGDMICRTGFAEKFPDHKLSLTRKFDMTPVEDIIYKLSASMDLPFERMMTQLTLPDGASKPLMDLPETLKRVEDMIYSDDEERNAVHSDSISIDINLALPSRK